MNATTTLTFGSSYTSGWIQMRLGLYVSNGGSTSEISYDNTGYNHHSSTVSYVSAVSGTLTCTYTPGCQCADIISINQAPDKSTYYISRYIVISI
jgi:hypothetical protein